MKVKKEQQVAYLCNGENPKCSGKDGCYYRTDGKHGPCSHTLNPKYAKNKEVTPENNEDKFDKHESESIVRYYEKFDSNWSD